MENMCYIETWKTITTITNPDEAVQISFGNNNKQDRPTVVLAQKTTPGASTNGPARNSRDYKDSYLHSQGQIVKLGS